MLLLSVQTEVVTGGLQRVIGSDPVPQIHVLQIVLFFFEVAKKAATSLNHTEEETSD